MKHPFKLLPMALLAFSMGAQAAMIVTIQEVGDDVILSGSGSIDRAGMFENPAQEALELDMLDPTQQFFVAGTTKESMKTTGFLHSGLDSFGSGSETQQTTNNSGDLFGFHARSAPGFGLVYLPSDYVYGEPLAFSSTFKNTTLTELGIKLGEITWTLNNPLQPQATDTITLNVIPPPSPQHLQAPRQCPALACSL